MSYADVELKVIRWGEARGIVQNSNNMAQALKTLEEVQELLTAIHAGDREAQADAYGDILVTLVMGCATADLDLTECFEKAFQEIKNRKGYLRADGVFVKESGQNV
jgi:NTP pyrophosphatase (non-canonical NTP hydrolase)